MLDQETSEELKLAIRASRCKYFRAMNGMLDLRGVRLNVPGIERFSVVLLLPDFKDEQTMECLRTLVRNACQDLYVSPRPLNEQEREDKISKNQWAVDLEPLNKASKNPKWRTTVFGRTEAEALIQALESAELYITEDEEQP
jgi:hypothetical protein